MKFNLINGRGQLGTELSKINDFPQVVVYHTWNFMDKSKRTQEYELRKLDKFLDAFHVHYFISTMSSADNYYVKAKRRAERMVLKQGGKIIRLPNLIGKGACDKLRSPRAKPQGLIELMTPVEAAFIIRDIIEMNSPAKIYNVHGEKITAKLAQDLIKFGGRYD
jgi:hypothetical protein